jgi:iron(III) transport system substrate-binding protein
MSLNRIESIFISCVVSFFLCLSFLIVSFHKASAAESEAERTAKLVEGAKKEGKLLWYTAGALEDSEKLLMRFKEKYPFIDTEMYRTGAEGMIARITTEARAKTYLWDLVQIGGIKDEIIKRNGHTAKYLSPQRQFVPEVFRDPEGYWTAIYVIFYITAYNTDLVSAREAPKTYADLLDPKWKGKMGMDTNSDDWFANMLKIMGEQKGLEYMKTLAKQDIQFRTGRTVNTQMLAAGELSIGVALYNQRIEEWKRKGSPVEWVAMEPVIPEMNPIAISARAPHPNTAKLFVDFVLSREGQEMISSFLRIPVRADVEAQIPGLKLKGQKIWPVDLKIADDYGRYLKLFREIFKL